MKKKLIGTFIFIFVIYVVYYDLSQGTLSRQTSIVLLQTTENKNNEHNIKNKQQPLSNSKSSDQSLYFKKVKVTAGQTVLSIVEQIHNGPLPVSISQIITDFQALNPKTEPERIQIGKVYKFPVYHENKHE